MITGTDKKKKLIRFSNIYDYNYLLYNLIIILNALKCYDDTFFKDYRKLPVLIEILNNNRLCNIILNNQFNNKEYNLEQQDILYDLIGRAKNIRKQVFQLSIIMQNKEIINTRFQSNNLDLSLKKNTQTEAILNNTLFESDINKINKITKAIKRVKILKYETFLNNIFDSKGVFTWQL